MSGNINATANNVEKKMKRAVKSKMEDIDFEDYEDFYLEDNESAPYYQLYMSISGYKHNVEDFICHSDEIKKTETIIKGKYPDDEISYIVNIYFTDEAMRIYVVMEYDSMDDRKYLDDNDWISYNINKKDFSNRQKLLYDLIINNRIPK